jgi:tetratricopeptide (TPR) repeat protein
VFAALRAMYRLSGLSGLLTAPFSRRDYTYWVGMALGESNPEKRVSYCSKALRLNPNYEPAWGLKAFTLLDLKRYEEASPCFEKVLQLRPNAVAWHKQGLCYYHLKRHAEAAACFEKATAACAEKDRQLFDEASRYKRLALESLSSVTT